MNKWIISPSVSQALSSLYPILHTLQAGGPAVLMVTRWGPGWETKPLNPHLPQAPGEQVQLSANGKALLFCFEKQYTEKTFQFLQRICSNHTKFFAAVYSNSSWSPSPAYSSSLTSHYIQAYPFLIRSMTQTFSLPSLISQPCLNCPQIFRIILTSRGRLIISGILS